MLAGAVEVVEQAAWNARLASSLGIDSEVRFALTASVFGHEFAVRDRLDLNLGHATASFELMATLTSFARSLVVILDTLVDFFEAFSSN